ncbi:hypothetical protein [Paraburkholderia megapolitana]|uniref:hypothetical protein n=1 Tax=Paraburkholderia megapolitana TaxID=420953 RepID=UPI0038B71EB7
MSRHLQKVFIWIITSLGPLSCAVLLGGCGGDIGASAPSGQVGQAAPGGASTTTPPAGGTSTSQPTGQARQKALVIGVSGVQYSALQQALAQHQAPNLAQMAIVPALAGGIAGTPTQQATLAAPGWATVLTGTWANRHGVRQDDATQTIAADTVFKLAKLANAQGTAEIASWSTLDALLSGDADASVDCAGVDSCVVKAATAAILTGNDDLIFANLSGPAVAAQSAGLQAGYVSALATADQEIGQLQTAIAARQKQNGVNENWLVIVTTDEGLDATGSESGLPLLSNETAFIASNQPLTVGSTTASTGTIAAKPTLAQLQAGATQADITPTVLSWFGAVANPTLYAIDGTSLIGKIGPRLLQATPGSDQASLNLSWALPPVTPSQLLLYRDGTLLATLPGNTQSYADTQLGKTTSGAYSFNYTLSADGAAVSTLAQINYVQSVVLDPTLGSGLIHFFSFDKGLADAIAPGVALAQFNATSTTTASFVPDSFGFNALQVASLISTPNAGNGMKLTDDVSNKPQFSFGFWFYSNDGQSDSPVISNKNWWSGGNPGFNIAEESGSQLKFNISDGSSRSDAALNFTKNAWVYVAMTVDTTAQTAVGYIYDPTYGMESATLSMSGFNMSKIAGVYSTIGFNEDATGNYYTRTTDSGGNLGTMTFNDIAMWNKVLTSAQVLSLGASTHSLSTLVPGSGGN